MRAGTCSRGSGSRLPPYMKSGAILVVLGPAYSYSKPYLSEVKSAQQLAIVSVPAVDSLRDFA